MKKDKTAYILNCVEDAKHLIKNGIDINSHSIFTTHYSVNDYLDSKGLGSIHLSKFLSDDSLNASILSTADKCVNDALENMDKLLSHKISSILGLNLNKYFFPLYAYLSKLEYTGYCLFIHILDVFLVKNFSKIIFYNSSNISFYTKNQFFLNFIKKCLENSPCLFETVTIEMKGNESNVKGSVRKSINKLHNFLTMVKNYFSIHEKENEPNNYIILLEKLYDLEFLKYNLGRKPLIWSYNGENLKYTNQEISADQLIQIKTLIKSVSISDISKSGDPILEVIIKIILKDFDRNILANLTPVLAAQFIIQSKPIKAVVWGNPPIRLSKSLVNEFFLESGIPVIGMQHGSSYGVQKRRLTHFESDFDRCTHYLTYGFDQKDLRVTYPDRNVSCEIIPVGTTKKIRKQTQKNSSNIDILFPITNCISFWVPKRINPYLLAKYQEKIINKLDRLKGLKTVIKPMRGYTDKNFAFSERVKKLSNLKLSTEPLGSFLEKFSPKLIIIEYPSTPLYETLGEDAEILILNDSIITFNPEALHLLKKRVHIFDDIKDLLESIDLWCEGKLTPLRDNQFYYKYVYRENARDNILSEINHIIEPV